MAGLGNALAIAVGQSHSCAIRSADVVCWGRNNRGQLGNGTTTNSAIPVVVQSLPGAFAIAAGGAHSCAVLPELDTAFCWGDNTRGQLGNGAVSASPVLTPVQVSGLSRPYALAAGSQHSCAASFGAPVVACWGANGSGQLGNDSVTDSATPVQAQGLTDTGLTFTVAAGLNHSCARRGTDGVFCWGHNAQGALGTGTDTDSRVPVKVPELDDPDLVVAGGGLSCTRRASGQVVCWGRNTRGQLGDGTTQTRLSPVAVVGLTDAESLSAGFEHVCATRAAGGLVCWGNGDNGRLGLGVGIDQHAPARVRFPVQVNVTGPTSGVFGAPLTFVATVTSGVGTPPGNVDFRHDISSVSIQTLDAAGTASVTFSPPAGSTTFAAHYLGSDHYESRIAFLPGNLVISPAPTTTVITGPTTVTSGNSFELVATVTSPTVTPQGGIRIRINDESAFVGSLTPDGTANVVVEMPVGTHRVVAEFFGGTNFTNSVSAEHEVTVLAVPTVTTLTGATTFLASQPIDVEAVVTSDVATPEGAVSFTVTGDNAFDLLRELDAGGRAALQSFAPVGRYAVTAEYSGGTGSGGVTFGGSVSSVFNFEVLPVPTTTTLTGPGTGNPGELLAFGATVISHAIPPGVGGNPTGTVSFRNNGLEFATAALDQTGQAVVRARLPPGINAISAHYLHQQNSIFGPSDSAVLATTVLPQVVTGQFHSCALHADQQVRCWGRNAVGQLGDGTTDNRLVPVLVPGLDRVVQIAVGDLHSCALRDSGRVFCWGAGGSGQLGDGSTDQSPVPVRVR